MITLPTYSATGFVYTGQAGLSLTGTVRLGVPISAWRPATAADGLGAWGQGTAGVYVADVSGAAVTRDTELFLGEQLVPAASTAWDDILDAATLPVDVGGEKGGDKDYAGFFAKAFPSAIPAASVAWTRACLWTREQQGANANVVSFSKSGIVLNRYVGQRGRCAKAARNARYRLSNVGWMTAGTCYLTPNKVFVWTADGNPPQDAWLSTCTAPGVLLQGCTDVDVSGLRLIGGLSDSLRMVQGCRLVYGDMVDLVGGRGNGIVAGTFAGGTIVSLDRADHVVLQNVRAKDIGGSALQIHGGNWAKQRLGGAIVSGIRLQNCGRYRRDAIGVSLSGVGPRLTDMIATGHPGRVVQPQHPYGSSTYTDPTGHGFVADGYFARMAIDCSAAETSDDGAIYIGGTTVSTCAFEDVLVTNNRPPVGQGSGQTRWSLYVDNGQTDVTGRNVQAEDSFGGVSINGGGGNTIENLRLVRCDWPATVTDRGDATGTTFDGLALSSSGPLIDTNWKTVTAWPLPNGKSIVPTMLDTGWTVQAPRGVPVPL